MLERLYGSGVVLTYRFDGNLAPEESPVVLVDGMIVVKGGLVPVPVVNYLDRLGVPRIVPVRE
ncbi:hypothetical protein [Desulfofundulus thermosubterraneus]|uniref:hypothetical protein n=1 Tax=Desulfofundulus thermosubterraneus TaxID=348840 RepID=UPI0009353D1E|nr:hypothetical protein [Desulfofundulus thermosubterraneus]